MSYDSQEQGAATSQPAELYDLYDVMGNHWRYTSSSEIQTYLSHDYAPEVINRKAIEISENQFKNMMEITLGRNNAFAIQYIVAPPESKIGLFIYRLQGADYIMYWSGIVQMVTFDKNGVATAKATMNTATFGGVSKRRRCQILCDHALYDAGCKVNKEAYKTTGNLTSVVGKTLKAAEFAAKANGYFIAGQIKIGDARRLIKSHTGDTIIVTRPFINIEIGNSFAAYAGCNHTPEICWSKFINSVNFGGQEFLPTKNPASGILGADHSVENDRSYIVA